MTVKYLQRPWLLALLLSVLISGGAVGQCPPKNVPASLITYVERQYPEWHIVEVKDLDDYHKKLWRSEHKNDCPGVATGRFEPTGLWKWAILLVPDAANDNRAKVLLLKQERKSYSAMTLVDIPNRGFVPTISKAPPGQYKVWDSHKKIRARYAAVALVFYESSATVFYWNNGKFHEIQVSD